jgi:hypothetical protein
MVARVSANLSSAVSSFRAMAFGSLAGTRIFNFQEPKVFSASASSVARMNARTAATFRLTVVGAQSGCSAISVNRSRTITKVSGLRGKDAANCKRSLSYALVVCGDSRRTYRQWSTYRVMDDFKSFMVPSDEAGEIAEGL